jgi:hypothetical protein
LKLQKPKFPSSNVLASTKFPVRRKDVVISTSDKVEGKYKHVSFNIRAFKNKKQEKSAVALHMLTKDGAKRNYSHNFDHTSLELVNSVTNAIKLDALE